ncbi:MAG: ATP-binding protein [Chlamydiales bacterium]|nr:ATP-binding protein [Chlamydiales bacterium]
MLQKVLFLVLLVSFKLSACAFHTGGPVKVIITGDISGGKTSVVTELAARGYQVVPEVATTVFVEEYKKLDALYPEKAPHNHPLQIENLQQKIFAGQEKAYNEALVKSMIYPPKNNLIIFDRTEFDSYVYSQIFYPTDYFTTDQREDFSKRITRALTHQHYNQNAIFCDIVPKELYNGRMSNCARHENYNDAVQIGSNIHKYYKEEFGFILHHVGFHDTIASKTDTVEALLLNIAACQE